MPENRLGKTGLYSLSLPVPSACIRSATWFRSELGLIDHTRPFSQQTQSNSTRTLAPRDLPNPGRVPYHAVAPHVITLAQLAPFARHIPPSMYTALLSRFSAFLAALSLLVFTGPEVSILEAEDYVAFMEGMLQWGEYAGFFAVGWGTGALVWLITAHQALRCLFFDLPQGWTLWQNGVLTSVLPALKYLMTGALFLGATAFLAQQLVGTWDEGFYVGVLAGAITGALWSTEKGWQGKAPIDFLLRNRRYVDTNKIPMFKHVD